MNQDLQSQASTPKGPVYNHRFSKITNFLFLEIYIEKLFSYLPKPDSNLKTKDYRKRVVEIFLDNGFKQFDRSCFFIKENMAVMFQTGNKMNAAVDLLYLQNEYIVGNIYGAIYCIPSEYWRKVWSEGVIEIDNVKSIIEDCKSVITVPITIFEF